MSHATSEGQRRKGNRIRSIDKKAIAQRTINEVIDEYCGVVGVPRPVMIYSESVFAAHKAKAHDENREDVLKDIRESNSGRNRALTCDRCFATVLMRPKNLGIMIDPKTVVSPISNLKENIRFLLLHELIHVKLRDSDYKKTASYHGQNLVVEFNRCAEKLGVTKYKEYGLLKTMQ